MVGYTDIVVYPVVQFILKVHQLLFSEDLGKNINSSTPICIHMASCNFLHFVNRKYRLVLSALNALVNLGGQ